MKFDFKIWEMWDQHLPKHQANWLKNQAMESFEALKNCVEILEGKLDVEQTRFPIAIETPPTQLNYQKKYLLATDQEFLHIKQHSPDLQVRLLTQEERINLAAEMD